MADSNKSALIFVSNDRLILFCVNLLECNKIEATFDKVVVASFKLFPKKFSLIGFSEYPDGKKIHDCLFHCTYKPKNWLIGNAQSGYRVTDRGKYFLDETKKIMNGEISLNRKYSGVAKRKEVTFISILKKTTAYKKYQEKKGESLNEAEILEALRVNEDSKNLLKKHYDKYMDYANRIEDKEVLSFLKFIKGKVEI